MTRHSDSLVLSRRNLIMAGGSALAASGIPGVVVAAGAATADAGEIVTITRVVRDMFPHRNVPVLKFRDFAARLVTTADSPTAAMLTQGCAELDRRAGGAWRTLDSKRRRGILEGMGGTPFFSAVRTGGLLALYTDLDVTRRFGYEGPSLEKGGYLLRGFNDLDWLPEPA